MESQKNAMIRIIEELEGETVKLQQEKSTKIKELDELSIKQQTFQVQTRLLEDEKLRLETEKKKLEIEKDSLKKEKDQVEFEKEQLKKETDIKEKKIGVLSSEQEKIIQERDDKEVKLAMMTENQLQLLKEYEILKEELKKFQELAALEQLETLEETDFNFNQVRNLLKIYSVLIETIWAGAVHTKILNLLHGDKEELDRNSIKNATGIAGAVVLRAIHELSRENLVTYDEDTGMVKLVKRLFPRK